MLTVWPNFFFGICRTQLNRLFRMSDVGMYFQRCEILEITPNMTVKSIAIFRSSDNVNVGRIGLAFLRSLRMQHGHTHLGIHTINVQSIGFQSTYTIRVLGTRTTVYACHDDVDVHLEYSALLRHVYRKRITDHFNTLFSSSTDVPRMWEM